MIREMPDIAASGRSALDQARAEILAVQGEIALMGANNSEFGDIAELLGKLERGEVEPAAAVQAAHLIQASKQDYH
jgi:hypothetical protein